MKKKTNQSKKRKKQTSVPGKKRNKPAKQTSVPGKKRNKPAKQTSIPGKFIDYKSIAKMREKGCPARYIAKKLGIDRKVIYETCRTVKYKKFFKEIQRTEEEKIKAIRESIIKAIEKNMLCGFFETSHIKKKNEKGRVVSEIIKKTKKSITIKDLAEINKITGIYNPSGNFKHEERNTKEEQERRLEAINKQVKIALNNP